MRDRFSHHDLPGLTELVHQLVSASGFVGAWKMIELSKSLTILNGSMDSELIGKKLRELEAESNLTKEVLSAYWRNIKTAHSGVFGIADPE